MCYGYKPVKGKDGRFTLVDPKTLRKLEDEGKIIYSSDGYHYAKAAVGVLFLKDGNLTLLPMRWDLVPRDFMIEHPEFDLATVIKKKNSRAKNPDTQKAWGFDSFNARKETLASRPAFRKPWKEGLRCVMPVEAFQERANMDGAPAEFKNRSWEITLDTPAYLGGIYDTWERNVGRLDSCTVITMDSEGHEKLRSIWHERHPLILREDQVEEWLDPKTKVERAREMVQQFDPNRMSITEIIKPIGKARPGPSSST